MSFLKRNKLLYFLALPSIFVLLLLTIENKITFNKQNDYIDRQFQQLIAQIEEGKHYSLQTKKEIVTAETNQQHKENVNSVVMQKLQKMERTQKKLQQIVSKQEKSLILLKEENKMLANISQNEIQPLALEAEIFSQADLVAQQKEEYIHHVTNKLEMYWSEANITTEQNVESDEITLRDNLALSEDDEIIYISCKSSICKLELQQTAAAEEDISSYTGVSDVFKRIYPNPDGSQRVVMYIGLENTPFPEGLFEE